VADTGRVNVHTHSTGVNVHCAQPDGAIRAQIKYIQIELTSDLHGHHRFIVVNMALSLPVSAPSLDTICYTSALPRVPRRMSPSAVSQLCPSRFPVAQIHSLQLAGTDRPPCQRVSAAAIDSDITRDSSVRGLWTCLTMTSITLSSFRGFQGFCKIS